MLGNMSKASSEEDQNNFFSWLLKNRQQLLAVWALIWMLDIASVGVHCDMGLKMELIWIWLIKVGIK